MSYYHYCTAEIDVWDLATEEDLYPIFRDLLTFYGMDTFDHENTTEDATIVLTNRPAYPNKPKWSEHRDWFVRVEEQGEVSSDIEDVIKVTCERISRHKRMGFTNGVFVLTNADMMTKTRIPYGPTVTMRQNAVLRSCLDEFMDSVAGTVPATRHNAMRTAMQRACADATAFHRK